MSIVSIDIDNGNLSRIQRILSGIPGGTEKAVKGALQRSLSHLRAQSAKEIRKKYAIGIASIRANQNIKTDYKYGGGVITATITFNGNKIPLYRYDGASPKVPTVQKDRFTYVDIGGTVKRVHPGVAARGHQFTSTSPTRFDNAFVAQMKSGHIGIFERDGESIQEMMGSSVAQMVGNEEVRDTLVEQAYEKFDERLDHEMLAILNGWR